MDDPYFRLMVRERLAEVEALAESRARARSARPRRRPLRVRAGLALVAVGRRLARCAEGPPARDLALDRGRS